jgi:hypothetical protein
MSDIPIEQAIYGSHGEGGYRFLARSPGFLDEWLPEAERLCTGFGDRPAGVACPAAVFARPLGKRHVTVVQVADQGHDDAGRPGALGFHLLVLPRPAYRGFGGDPFALAERCPPPWQARGDLPALSWPAEVPPPRTVEQVRQVLRRNDGPELLGGSQVLVDGGRLVFERPAPDAELLRGLWTLLPTSTRGDLWPASFAFGNALCFDALVVPRAGGEEAGYTGYTTEEQAGNYPDGRYEHSLQVAAQAGDQAEIDALFNRRSRRETLRLALILLAIFLVLPLFVNLLTPSPEPGPKPPAAKKDGPPVPDLPPARELDAAERERLTQRLRELARDLNLAPAANANAEGLLEAIDAKLGTPDPERQPGPLAKVGPLDWQLRALLWKHGVAAYREGELTAVQLVERLQQKVVPP